jgi:catechol 2,3-dioxygenase-like lactoylglutathione lyase family enzyme
VDPFELYEVTLDCPEPRELAEFYRRLLGWTYAQGHETPDPAGDDWLVLLPPRGGTRLAFQRSDAPVIPWRQNARVHIDVAVPELAHAHDHFLACGAHPLTGPPEREGHPDDPYRVYADPVGHAFCATRLTQDRERGKPGPLLRSV